MKPEIYRRYFHIAEADAGSEDSAPAQSAPQEQAQSAQTTDQGAKQDTAAVPAGDSTKKAPDKLAAGVKQINGFIKKNLLDPSAMSLSDLNKVIQFISSDYGKPLQAAYPGGWDKGVALFQTVCQDIKTASAQTNPQGQAQNGQNQGAEQSQAGAQGGQSRNAGDIKAKVQQAIDANPDDAGKALLAVKQILGLPE